MRSEIKVLLTQPHGSGAGVVRAKSGPPIYVRHEIVHNRHVVEGLKARARVVGDVCDVPDGAVTILGAHGLSRNLVEEARSPELSVLDASCPLVAKVHDQGRRSVAQWRTLVLIGDAGHPEVDGTLGQIDLSWLDGVDVVGVTARASAPEVLVQDVIEALRRVAPIGEVSVLPGIEEHMTSAFRRNSSCPDFATSAA